MSLKTFTPLSLTGIEQGQFVVECDEELMKLQAGLLAHMKKYGDDAGNVSAVLTMKVELKSHKEMPDVFQIKTTVSRKVPGRPDGVSTAVAAEDQTGQLVLHMQPSGTNSDHPDQTRLATADGRTVDPDTGQPEQPLPD